jgi:hypothetical protein
MYARAPPGTFVAATGADRFRGQGSRYTLHGERFRVQGLGFRIQGLGFRVVRV